jgi:hypothetical protein
MSYTNEKKNCDSLEDDWVWDSHTEFGLWTDSPDKSSATSSGRQYRNSSPFVSHHRLLLPILTNYFVILSYCHVFGGVRDL